MHIYEDFYKQAKYHAVKLIKQKKSQLHEQKVKENIGKPKELWKGLKFLSLSSKKGKISNICLKKMAKYALLIKQMQIFLRNYFVI